MSTEAKSSGAAGAISPQACAEAMKTAIRLSKESVERGNHPFGALLLDPNDNKVVLTALNRVHTGKDVTLHAELNLMRDVQAHPRLMDRIQELVLVTSTEPCAMCSGSIWWTGVRHIVYGCSEAKLSEIVDQNPKLRGGNLNASCPSVLGKADAKVIVVGPVLEEEAAAVHRTYWTKL